MIKQSVSILTVTQLSRHKCLLNLVNLIKLQTYKNIIEWVIIEGSNNKEDANKNEKYINTINVNEPLLNIVYVNYTGYTFDNLHNLGTSMCKGNIIVIMDDDDYYPVTRVQHAVKKLEDSDYLISGCSDVYMYSFINQQLYKFKSFGENHSCNHALAFIKEYAYYNKYKDDGYSIEKSFTKNFTEPMLQLEPLKTVVVSSHKFNSVNKNIQIDSWIENKVLNEVNNIEIESIIPENIFYSMNEMFETNRKIEK